MTLVFRGDRRELLSSGGAAYLVTGWLERDPALAGRELARKIVRAGQDSSEASVGEAQRQILVEILEKVEQIPHRSTDEFRRILKTARKP